MAAALQISDNSEQELEQGYIDPDFKPTKNKNVHPKAKKYHDLKAMQEVAKEAADEAHDVLLDAMQKEGLEVYVYRGMIVKVKTKRKCAVKMKGEEADANS